MRMGGKEVYEMLGTKERRCQRSRDPDSLTHVGSHIFLTAVSNADVMMRLLAGLNLQLRKQSGIANQSQSRN